MDHQHLHQHLTFTIYIIKQSITGLAKRVLIIWSLRYGSRMERGLRHSPICCLNLISILVLTTPMCHRVSHPHRLHRDCCHRLRLLETWILVDPSRLAIVSDQNLIVGLPQKNRYQTWSINVNGGLLISRNWVIRPSTYPLIFILYVSVYTYVCLTCILIVCSHLAG